MCDQYRELRGLATKHGRIASGDGPCQSKKLMGGIKEIYSGRVTRRTRVAWPASLDLLDMDFLSVTAMIGIASHTALSVT